MLDNLYPTEDSISSENRIISSDVYDVRHANRVNACSLPFKKPNSEILAKHCKLYHIAKYMVLDNIIIFF